jgi:hypothetical protein
MAEESSFTMVEAEGKISYRRLPGAGSVAGGSLLELEISTTKAETPPDEIFLHIDLVRHVWGVVDTGCAALVSQHGTHVTLRLDDSLPPWRVVVEIGYDPVFGTDPKVACKHDGSPHLRKLSDVQDGAYLELRPAATAAAVVVVPLTIGKLDLGFEAAGPLSPPPPATRDAPPALDLRTRPPFHMQTPPPTPAFAYRALLLDVVGRCGARLNSVDP